MLTKQYRGKSPRYSTRGYLSLFEFMVFIAGIEEFNLTWWISINYHLEFFLPWNTLHLFKSSCIDFLTIYIPWSKPVWLSKRIYHNDYSPVVLAMDNDIVFRDESILLWKRFAEKKRQEKKDWDLLRHSVFFFAFFFFFFLTIPKKKLE